MRLGTVKGDPSKLACCAALVLALHGIALALADARPHRRLPADVPGNRSVLVRTLAIDAAPRAQSRDPEPAAAEEPRAATSAEAIAAASAAAPATPEASALADGAVEAPGRFYRFSEVDVAAEPSWQWNVALESLDAAGRDRVAFDVWIDDRGRILACTLLDAAAVDPAVRASLEAQLMSTELQPAVRDGSRVASHRRVEIYVDVADTARHAR